MEENKNNYFTSTDESWLQSVNQRGLPRGPKDGTANWVDIIKHPERDEWAAAIPDDFMTRLSEIVSGEELTGNAQGPFTEEQMRAGGWFPAIEL